MQNAYSRATVPSFLITKKTSFGILPALKKSDHHIQSKKKVKSKNAYIQ